MEHPNPTEEASARTPVPPDVRAERHPIPETPDAGTGPSTQDAPSTVKPATLLPQDSTDSGIDAGSSSEYDQENHGDHVIEAQLESDFSDEG